MKNLSKLILIIFVIASTKAISQSNNLNDQKNNIADLNETKNSFIDTRDNQEYRYVDIDGKQWMAENLNFKTPKSLAYNNDEKHTATYGRLYIWEEAKIACPDKWRLPTEDDWKQLELFLGIDSATVNLTGWRGDPLGNSLKCKTKKIWLSNIHMNANDIGFDALAGGVAHADKQFANIGLGGYFWSATNYYSSLAWSRYLIYDNGEIFRNVSAIDWSFSVRCIKD